MRFEPAADEYPALLPKHKSRSVANNSHELPPCTLARSNECPCLALAGITGRLTRSGGRGLLDRQDSKSEALCRNCPKPAPCRCRRRRARQPCPCGRAVAASRAGCQVPNRDAVVRAAGCHVPVVEEHQRVDLAWSAIDRLDVVAIRGIKDSNLRAIAGCRQPAPVGRESHRSNSAMVGFDIGLARSIGNVPNSYPPVSAGSRHSIAIGREHNRANIHTRTIQLLRFLSRRAVDDLELIAESDHRELLTVRMKAHGSNTAFAGWNLHQSLLPSNIPHRKHAVAGARG